MSSPELEEALAGAQRGEDRAVAQLFRALHPQLLRYLRQRAPTAAEDLASETWLAAARLLPTFEGSFGEFRALLFTIARRRLVDHQRAHLRRPRTVPLAQAPADPAASGAEEEVLGAASAQAAIEALVQALPPEQAEVLLLRVVAGLRAEEVARVLGRSTVSVRVLQHRALRRLAARLGRDAVTP
ncbi:MAG TPA: sigma-70 family RNA polymerase sigma factor [Acidimicrobiales bacterium]|nr:sigma-70 family RNA polymerase sigma factor [Acidimicrobiales bacterium]